MVLNEYQAKRILVSSGLTIPVSTLVDLRQPVLPDLNSLRFPLVAKAQVPTGRRGKRGGVLNVQHPSELSSSLQMMNDLSLDGYKVHQVLLEEHVGEHRAFYLSLMLDRNQQRFLLLASPQGGVDIEESASSVKQWHLSYLLGIPAYVKRQVATHLGLSGEATNTLRHFLVQLFEMVRQWGILFIEINPLALMSDNRLVVLDVKMTLDDKANIYAPESIDQSEYLTIFQQQITNLGIAGVEMPPGNIAVITSGAGVGMATVDCVNYLGGQVCAFIDLGGIGVRESDTTRKAIQLLQDLIKPDVYLFNFFFQLADSAIVAKAISDMFKTQIVQPVARFRGHHETEACSLVTNVSEYVTTDFIEACRWAVELSRGGTNGDPA